MPGIIAWPTVVEEALRQSGDLFTNEPERRHCAEYLTGLLVAQRKTVAGINAEFAVTTDQSCLNRWITEVALDVQALNERRLQGLPREPSTRAAAPGVIALENTLMAHDSTLIEDVGWFWDHAESHHPIAHDYLITNDVCPSGKHSVLDFRRFRKEADCSPESFNDHTALFCEVIAHEIPGECTFDCDFTSAAILSKRRGDVGDLKCNRTVEFAGRGWKAAEVAARSAEGRPDRGRAPVGLHEDDPHPDRPARAPLGSQERRRADQEDPDEQDRLGDHAPPAGLPQTLDGHRDLPSGRQAAPRDG